MTESQGLGAVQRVRPYIHRELCQYWDRPFIHKVDPEDRFSYIAVVGDHTPIMINRPYCPTNSFAYGKQTYDKHHGMYALKKHVVVSATSPYYAVAWNCASEGSCHDMKDLILTWQNMYPHLLAKKPEDAHLFPQQPTWAVLLDSGYVGPEPYGLNKVVIPKPSSRTTFSSQDVSDLKKKRVIVECFFGRMTVLWRCLLSPYLFDKAYLDMDVENMIMLTNSHIEEHQKKEPLGPSDAKKYVDFVNLWKQAQSKDKEIYARKNAKAKESASKKARVLAQYTTEASSDLPPYILTPWRHPQPSLLPPQNQQQQPLSLQPTSPPQNQQQQPSMPGVPQQHGQTRTQPAVLEQPIPNQLSQSTDTHTP
ncbi:hypothetical protein Pelo_15358 [Pelomyxa schiedti]|nr:hypothetical protein Pelo_15358 [Pelomyxa schiedti]